MVCAHRHRHRHRNTDTQTHRHTDTSLRTGMFHMKEGGCAIVLQKDLEYWIIGRTRAGIGMEAGLGAGHNEKQTQGT